MGVGSDGKCGRWECGSGVTRDSFTLFREKLAAGETEACAALVDSLIERLDHTIDEGAEEAWREEIYGVIRSRLPMWDSRRSEEIALARRNNVRKDNDRSGMELFLSVECSEIRAVVRNKRVILSADPSHQLPILVPAKPEEVHVFTHMSGMVRHRNE
jgi:hypothetical protein